MDKRSAAPDGNRHMEGFRHLLEIGTFLLTILGVRVDAIGALHGVRNRKRNEALLTG